MIHAFLDLHGAGEDARHWWGTFHAVGSDHYKRLCVELAGEHGFRIVNPELRDEIARARPPLTVAVSPELEARRPAPSRPPAGGISDAYRRHFEDVKGAPEGRKVDASRLDALVAVRLRATGYARDQVLYIFDEPEAALSPSRQMAALVRIHQLVEKGAQFIIATHSPILMAYPEAQILLLGGEPIRPVGRLQRDVAFTGTRDFLNNYQRALRALMDEEES